MQLNTNYSYRQPNLSSNNYLKTSDSYIEGNIEATYNIELDKCFAGGTTHSSLGKLSANDSRLQDVRVQYDATFKSCSARSVTSALGKITSMGSVFGSLKAQYDITLISSIATEVLSILGKIDWNCESEKPKASIINGQYDIVLNNIECLFVKSRLGHVKAKQSNLQEVECQYDVSLINTSAKVVRSTLGKIVAVNSELSSVTSQYNIELRDTSAEICYSKIGDIKITTASKKIYNKLEAQYNINLENIGVNEKVVSKLGYIRAKDSHLPTVSCYAKLSLQNSRAMSVTITASDKKEAVIELEDGVIEGDVTIEKSAESARINFDLNNFDDNEPTFEAPCEEAVDKQKIKLKITGNGKINGNIIFKNCEGSVVSADQLRGEIKFMN